MKVEITYNEKKNGIELRFSENLTARILSEVKTKMGFRHSRTKDLWWAKKTSQRIEFAKKLKEALESGQAPENISIEILPSYTPSEENIKHRNFSYVTIWYQDEEEKSATENYILFDPAKNVAHAIATEFGQNTFGDRFKSVDVYPRNYLREARKLLAEGKVIHDTAEKSRTKGSSQKNSLTKKEKLDLLAEFGKFHKKRKAEFPEVELEDHELPLQFNSWLRHHYPNLITQSESIFKEYETIQEILVPEKPQIPQSDYRLFFIRFREHAKAEIGQVTGSASLEAFILWLEENYASILEADKKGLIAYYTDFIATTKKNTKSIENLSKQKKQQPYSAIFNKLKKIIPDLEGRLKKGFEYGTSTFGEGSAFMDLNLDVLSKDEDGRYIIALSHYYQQNGDSIADPDMEIRIDFEQEIAEALTYQDSLGFQSVYHEKEGKTLVDLRRKKEQNKFLSQWLTTLFKQKHQIVWREKDTEDAPQDTRNVATEILKSAKSDHQSEKEEPPVKTKSNNQKLSNEAGVYTPETAGDHFETIEVPIPKNAKFSASIHLVKDEEGRYRFGLSHHKEFGDASGASFLPNTTDKTYKSRHQALAVALGDLLIRISSLLQRTDSIFNNEKRKNELLMLAFELIKSYAIENEIEPIFDEETEIKEEEEEDQKLKASCKKQLEKVIGELTDLEIDLDGEDETILATTRFDLEDTLNKDDPTKVKEAVEDFNEFEMENFEARILAVQSINQLAQCFNFQPLTTYQSSPGATVPEKSKAKAVDIQSRGRSIPNVLVPSQSKEPFFSQSIFIRDAPKLREQFPHLLELKNEDLSKASAVELFELSQMPHPTNYGFQVDRSALLSEWEKRGESLAEALGFPTDLKYPYVNIHTGYSSVYPLSKILGDDHKEWWVLVEHYRPIADRQKALVYLKEQIQHLESDLEETLNPKTKKPKKSQKERHQKLTWDIDSFLASIEVLEGDKKNTTTKSKDIRNTLSLEEFIDYGTIGFDKLSSYKPSVITKAKKVMAEAVKLGYAVPFDFGRGKGKYTTTDKGNALSYQDLFTKVYKNIAADELESQQTTKNKSSLPPENTPTNDYMDRVIAYMHDKYYKQERLSKGKIEKLLKELDVPNLGVLWETVELSWLLWYKNIYQDHRPFKERLTQMIFFWMKIQPTYAYSDSSKELYKQYSTPCPIAAMVAQYTGMDQAKNIFEPSAGNGLLVVGAKAKLTHVNEIDTSRKQSLSFQEFETITDYNAAKPFPTALEKSFDVMVTNPPFASWDDEKFDKEFIINNYFNNMIGLASNIRLEHVMSGLALRTLKDKGKAAIIIMGHIYFSDDGYIAKYRPFFNWLYRHYQVDDVINMNSFKLYNKQGAVEKTMLILIKGRKNKPSGVAPTKKQAPALDEMVNSFEELWERIAKHMTLEVTTIINQLKIELKG